MSSKGRQEKTIQTVGETDRVFEEPRRFHYGTSSLVLDEAELRRAGIHNYRVEIKSCSNNGTWKVLYNKSTTIAPTKKNSNKENEWIKSINGVHSDSIYKDKITSEFQ